MGSALFKVAVAFLSSPQGEAILASLVQELAQAGVDALKAHNAKNAAPKAA